ITLGGDRQWQANGFGTLRQHAESWMLRHPFRRLVVRYEDLKTDTAGQLRSILEFLDEKVDEDRLASALSKSSFDQMRAMEVRERSGKTALTSFSGGQLRTAAKAPRYFMNEGKTRGSLEHLGAGLDAAFDRRFGGLMRALGYSGDTERAA